MLPNRALRTICYVLEAMQLCFLGKVLVTSGYDEENLIMSNWQITPFLFDKVIPMAQNKQELFENFETQFKTQIKSLKLTQSRLFEVFTHKSFAHEVELVNTDNEKLEFIGDAALDTVVSTIIYKKYPEMSEGELSKLRSAIVNEKSLSEIALILGLGKYIILGRGELKLKGYEKPSILANTLESLFGAIYLDQGLDQLFKVLEEIYALCLKEKFDFLNEDLLLEFDAKTKLQEMVMKRFHVLPEYSVSEIKEGKRVVFEVECSINNRSIAIHQSQSKKKAMQEIAAKILKEKLIENTSEKLCY